MSDKKTTEKEKNLLRLFTAQSGMFAFTVTHRLKEFLEKILNQIPGIAAREVCLFDFSETGKEIQSKLFGTFHALDEISNKNECIHLINRFKHQYQIYPVKTAQFFYGFIAVEVTNQNEFSDFDSILSNFAITVSIILENKQQKNALKKINMHLEKLVNERTRSLNQANQELNNILSNVIKTLSITVELRDPYTSGHQYRVAILSQAIAQKFQMPEKDIRNIYLGALIHDIGKIEIPIEILVYPGALSKLQFDYIKTHPASGKKIIEPIGFNETIVDIVFHHHERLNGSGYPDGLKQNEIPLSTRIVSVADVFEAMSSHRPYRPMKTIKETLNELRSGIDSLYDRQAVDYCIQLMIDEQFSLPQYSEFTPMKKPIA